MSDFNYLLSVELFESCLKEQQAVLEDFYRKARELLRNSGVAVKPMPEAWKTFRHNYFSVLFIAVFRVLGLPGDRRRFYARINHCLRSWVTACDNLLDHELKELIQTDLPQDAYVFKSVHTLLLTDRIFFSLLMDAADEGLIAAGDIAPLLNVSLAAISESGREEAEEENGVAETLSPGEMLASIHRLKTGHLFAAPLSAPLKLNHLQRSDRRVQQARQGLIRFGTGCQILDDISDLGMDLYYRKHNYLAAAIVHGDAADEKRRLAALCAEGPSPDLITRAALYERFPKSAEQAMHKALAVLHEALDLLTGCGLPLTGAARDTFVDILVQLFQDPDRLAGIRIPA